MRYTWHLHWPLILSTGELELDAIQGNLNEVTCMGWSWKWNSSLWQSKGIWLSKSWQCSRSMIWFIPIHGWCHNSCRIPCLFLTCFFFIPAQLLIRSGRNPEEALMILVPEAYKNHPTLTIKYPEVLLNCCNY